MENVPAGFSRHLDIEEEQARTQARTTARNAPCIGQVIDCLLPISGPAERIWDSSLLESMLEKKSIVVVILCN